MSDGIAENQHATARQGAALKRAALFLVIAFGALAGSLPIMAFFDWQLFSAAYATGLLLVALVVSVAVHHVAAQSAPPRAGAYLHSALAAAAFTTSASMIGLMLYGAAYGSAWSVRWAAAEMGWAWQIAPGAVATWVAGPFTLLFGLVALAFSPIPTALFPNAAAAGSAYEGKMDVANLLTRGALFMAGLALSLWAYWYEPTAWGWQLLATVLFAGAGSESMNAATEWSPAAVLGSQALSAVEKLYTSQGYSVVVSPRTKDQDDDINAELGAADLLATRGDDVLLIAVKPRLAADVPLSAADVALLPAAARTMARRLNQDRALPLQIHPVLVAVGRDTTADLLRLLDDEGMALLRLTLDDVRELLAATSPPALEALASRLLDPATAAP